MRIKVLAILGSILGMMLGASVALGSYPDQAVGLGNAEIWVVNLHESLDANVVVSFFDRDGFETDSEQATIDYLGNHSFPASTPDVDSGWLGSVAIDSLRPIASIAETVWEEVPADDNWTGAAFTDFSQGAQEIFFPAVSKTDRQESIMTIQCLDAEDCQVSMTYRDRDGNVITGSPFSDVIESYSQESYDLWDPSLNANVPDQQYTEAPWYGSLRVVSRQEIGGVQVTHWHLGYAGAHNSCIPGEDREIYFPSVKRRNFTNWTGDSDWSALTVQNLNAVAITANLSFYDRDGISELAFTDTIPAYSSHAYNTRYGGSVPASTFEELEHPFLGSAVVTSTEPILGTCNLIRGPSTLAASYNGVPGGVGEVVFPVAYRTKSGSSWTGYSGVIVQNLDPEDQITVCTDWRDQDGDSLLDFCDQIAANARHGYNTRYGGDTPGGKDAYNPLGEEWTGSVVVTTTSSAGIAALVESTISGADYTYFMQYNGVVVE